MGDLHALPPLRAYVELSPEQEGEARRITEMVMLYAAPAMIHVGMTSAQGEIVREGIWKGARAAVRFETAVHDGP